MQQKREGRKRGEGKKQKATSVFPSKKPEGGGRRLLEVLTQSRRRRRNPSVVW